MFQRIARSIRQPVLWLMVPLAVLAGRPYAGCVCVDGSVKSACCQTDWFLASLGTSPAKASDCCSGRHAVTCSHCCPHGGKQRTDNGPDGYSTAPGCHCQALANNVKPAKIADSSAADGLAYVPAPAAMLLVQPQVVASHWLNVPFDQLHPPDLVVLYLRLTI